MASIDQFKTTYFEECSELLDALYGYLGLFADGGADGETMHAVFRAVHSIKGGGGAFGFERLVKFAHVLETLLDLLRADGQMPTADMAALLIKATDTLSDLIDAARVERDPPPGFENELVALLEAAAEMGPAKGAKVPAKQMVVADEPDVMRTYEIRFEPHPELFKRANEPLLLIRELKRLGEASVTVDLSRLPRLGAIEPEHAYLSWSISLKTTAPKSAIEELFDFVVDDCDLTISTHLEPAKADHPLATVPPPQPTLLAETGKSEAGAPHSIRVDVDKVDRVVNLVGELVINQAMLSELSSDLPPDLCPGLVNGLETLSQHLRELQEGVMAMRAQPVKSVFARMPRLVREVAGQLHKEVRLVVTGEGTEIDKTVIEQLADPLTHLLRNALDHGIEMPEEREAAGKPRQGTIHLGAGHRSGRIVIEISDDGRGIDRARVLAKAESRGLVAPGSALSDEEIDNLIFLPGFSTAENISSISGRGVGMDVVKRNMQALGGRITVESEFGVGSRFVLSLPLTLAVLDGMVVAVGAETYIVPLTQIRESLRPKPVDIRPVLGAGDVLAIRGEYLPLVYLHRHFNVADAVTDPCRGIVMIVESEGDGRMCLVVDELVGQQQVVVKSLEANYDPVEGISGATILGNGRVALILDIGRLRDIVSPSSRRPPIASAEQDPSLPHGLH
jgi:two-component system chemotaxis sensor kinase CheA